MARTKIILALALLLLPAVGRPAGFKKKECLECHTKFGDKVLKLEQLHPDVKSGKCEECHLRHGIVPKLLLKKQGSALCLSCHEPKAIGLDQPNVHPALKDGQCTACHDAHGSNQAHLMKAAGAQACTGCHDKAAFEKKVVHEVLRKQGCAACHSAHASPQKNLLIAPEGKLCVKCHDGDTKAFRSAHGNLPVTAKACTTCHDPHSSEKPKLVKAMVHAPLKGGGCDACHAGASFALKKNGADLCYGCHPADVLVDEGQIPHSPLKKGDCLSCHDPHTSGQPKLLKAKVTDLCVGCHKQKGQKFSSKHSPVASAEGCLACHQAHAAKEKALLEVKPDALCQKCHGEGTKDQLGDKSVHAPFKEGRCTSCHDAHGSNYPGMLRDRADRVCYRCHSAAESTFVKSHTHEPVARGQCEG
ncbi:MAG TPA: cytochrome c3 family protein, partial [Myxococcales bacterium]|nr:cytochrome c3 family protein [Myxococcales bacterium]